jgi:serine/threonine protein kinase
MLTAGSRVAHYEVIAPIGAGGMGEVYRAHDTRIRRDVALKILPSIGIIRRFALSFIEVSEGLGDFPPIRDRSDNPGPDLCAWTMMRTMMQIDRD